eukprot:GEMP01042951.1.p1 GENE.GEMP01042951.1~~GEMP01042951.1.p1  ORF type:complete len:164 (+),score=15.65 GEMP01042951.1:87-578(+)
MAQFQRGITVLIASICGLVLAAYSIFVESRLRLHPGYEAACDVQVPFLGASSCSRVFNSVYSHILSYWGVVQPDSFFDWSLPQLAFPYFVITLHYPVLRRRFIGQYFCLTCIAIAFNLYLATILKFVLREFCVVCVSNYVLNAIIFYCCCNDYRANKMKPKAT